LLQHDLRQPHAIGVGPHATRLAPRQNARMAIIPGKQISGIGAACRFLSRQRADCYGHAADDDTRSRFMSKSARGFPRPLSDFASAAMNDALKAQGFASSEILARWADIAGPEIAAHSEPIKINWPRPLTAGVAAEAP